MNNLYICSICNNNYKSNRSLLYHVSKQHQLSAQEYYDLNYKKGYCEICNNPTTFLNYNLGYRKYCSSKCAANAESTKQKRIDTNLSKYGCENISQNSDIKQKKVATYLSHLDETKEKVKQTNQERYGCDWYTQTEEFKEKAKQTCLEKYNKDNYAKTDKWLKRYKKIHENDIQLYLDKGYIPTQELLIKYGTGWYQHKLVPTFIHKHTSYVKEEDVNIIENYSKNRFSKLESIFIDFIKSFYELKIILHSRKIIQPLELDIYLLDLNLAIEINGNYRHSINSGCAKNYHLNKSLACRDKNIRLIHIYEFEDLDKQKQLLKSLIEGQDNYPKNDFNKNNLLDQIPNPEVIYQNDKYTIYGAGPLIKNNH